MTRCEDCLWFDSSSHGHGVDDGGLCRFNAPVPDDRNGLARWPTVQHDDWCRHAVERYPDHDPETPPIAPAPAYPDDIPF